MKHILCADIGTTSLKLGIVSENSEVVCFSRHSFCTQNNFLANEWSTSFFEQSSALIKEFQQNGKELDAISLSGNGPTLILENGRTLLWNEKIEEKKILPEEAKSSMFIPHILFLKQNFPNEFNSSKYIFSNPEFLVYELTQNPITILPEERFTKAYWTNEILQKLGINPQKLPPFFNTAHNAGFTTKESTEKLGLKNKIPVFCTGPDFIASLIGTGTTVSSYLCDRAGSSEGINFCTKKPFYSPNLRTLPSVIPSLWNVSFIINKSGILMDEYKKQMETLEGKSLSYEEIISLCFEDKNSEGYHILSSLCSKIKNGIEELKNAAQKEEIPFPTCMTITGGQAKNKNWVKAKSFLCNIDIAVPKNTDAELLGNAASALFGLGKFSSLQEASIFISSKKAIFKTEDYKKTKQEYKIYKIPQNLKTIIFDIDSTLYTNASYAIEQVDVQIRHYAKKTGISAAEARNKITAFRRKWSKEHEGKKISLGNTLTYFGITIEESIKMRENLLEPKNFLTKDENLICVLKKLKEHYNLICVTNNPVLPAKKTLKALGVLDLIPEVIGLDTCLKSKPAKEPFEEAFLRTKSMPSQCISIGDRYDMDIALPLELGCGAILVSGVKDVYKLPELLGL